MNDDEIFVKLTELIREGKAGALCTIVRSQGSTPRRVGSKMLVYGEKAFLGTVGGGELENRVINEAMQSIRDGRTRFLNYSMVDPERGDPGVCGGNLDVYIEPYSPKPILLIIGAGHVGKAVAHLGKWLGFRVVVSDERAGLCNEQQVPGADAYYPVPMAKLPEVCEITPWTYIVMVTSGVDVDVAGLPALLDKDVAYLGVIGSKRRWLMTKKKILAQGIKEEALSKVKTPIGLELGAETPEEIAVSIMAEIIMTRKLDAGKIRGEENRQSDNTEN